MSDVKACRRVNSQWAARFRTSQVLSHDILSDHPRRKKLDTIRRNNRYIRSLTIDK